MRRILLAAALVSVSVSGAAAGSTNFQEKTIVKQQVGCRDLSVLTQAMTYQLQGDKEAQRRLLVTAAENGRCTLFKVGQTVFVVEDIDYSVRLRRKGETEEYWTSPVALRGVSDEPTPKKPELDSRAGPKVYRGGQ